MASSDYKKYNRQIKAYLDVVYDLVPYNISDMISVYHYTESGSKASIGIQQYARGLTSVINAELMPDDYAVLYEDYTELNGEHLVFKNTINNSGWISGQKINELHNLDNRSIIFEFALTHQIQGLTFYFRGNTIKNARVLLYQNVNQEPIIKYVTNNTKNILMIDFEEKKYIKAVVETTEWTHPNRYAWIAKLDLGLTNIYKDEQITEMVITEEVNKLTEDTPNNEISIKLGDYDKLYDPLNPQSITKYFKKDTSLLKPHIGIVKEDGTTEYTNLGTFYFNELNFKDKEVTIKGYNLMEIIKRYELQNNGGSFYGSSMFIRANQLATHLTNFLNTCYNFGNNVTIQNSNLLMISTIETSNLVQALQQITMFDGIMYVDRENKLVIRNIDDTIKYSISKNELLKDINYQNIENNDSYYYTRKLYNIGGGESQENTQPNFNVTFDLKRSPEYIVINNTPDNLWDIKTSDLTYTGASSVKVLGDSSGNERNVFANLIFLEVRGTVGANVNITATKATKANYRITNTNRILMGNNTSTNIEVSTTTFFTTTGSQSFLNKLYKYKVDFEYNGDPNIKAGDYAEVESNYGKVKFFITKHTLKYNGGLSGTIEGVE